MRIMANGTINDYISVAGNAIYPGYVVQGAEKSLMIDAGLNLVGPQYLQTLDSILGDRHKLTYLFVTHSHYDHLGAMPYIKRNMPDLQTGGHPRVQDLLRKESVLMQMTHMSELQRALFKDITGDEDVSLEPVDLDYALKEGDTFNLGGLTCCVYEVPGHTRDSLAYFFPETGALFPGESIGYAEDSGNDKVLVEFLSSYDDYLRSLEKIIALKPSLIGMGHAWIYTDDDARDFLDRSYQATSEHRRLIEQYLDSVDGDIDRAIEIMVRKEYDEPGTIRQERTAYLTNLTAQVGHIASLREEAGSTGSA